MRELWLWVKRGVSQIFADPRKGGVMGPSQITERPKPPGSMHRHDYEMQFTDDRNPLAYTLVCKCGDVAPSMEAALRRMGRLGPWPGY